MTPPGATIVQLFLFLTVYFLYDKQLSLTIIEFIKFQTMQCITENL